MSGAGNGGSLRGTLPPPGSTEALQAKVATAFRTLREAMKLLHRCHARDQVPPLVKAPILSDFALGKLELSMPPQSPAELLVPATPRDLEDLAYETRRSRALALLGPAEGQLRTLARAIERRIELGNQKTARDLLPLRLLVEELIPAVASTQLILNGAVPPAPDAHVS